MPRAPDHPATRRLALTFEVVNACSWSGILGAPLIPYRIRGVIWYQGESNVSRAWQYRLLFPTLINDWRAGILPFANLAFSPFERAVAMIKLFPALRFEERPPLAVTILNSTKDAGIMESQILGHPEQP